MAEDPYRYFGAAAGSYQNNESYVDWAIKSILVGLTPPVVAVCFYVPFVYLASELNTTIVSRYDSFYYPESVAVWPSYAASVGMALALVGLWSRLHWLGWTVLGIHGFIALFFYTEIFGIWYGSSGFARTGLDSWPANNPDVTITGPVISTTAVPVVYFVTVIGAWMIARFVSARHNPSSTLSHRTADGLNADERNHKLG